MKSLKILLALFAALSLSLGACDDDDDSSNNTNSNNNINTNNNTNNNTNDNTVQQVQNPNESGFVAVGDDVTLNGVVITAIDNYGSRTGNVWVSEPSGGAWSGVQVYNPSFLTGSLDALTVGTAVNVTGTKTEWNYNDEFEDPITEIEQAAMEVIGPTTPVPPVEIDPNDLNSVATGEQWEGVLVTLRNVRIREINDLIDTKGRYEVYLTPGTKMQDDLMDLSSMTSIAQGVCLSEVTGIVTYFYGYYLLPRSESDIVVSADDSACPQITDEVCDDGTDNDGDGFADCEDRDCWGNPPCVETQCDDGQDNDGDGFTDCDDFDCKGTGSCAPSPENSDTLCADGTDNDGDGFTDCEDPSCYGHPDVTVCKESNCTDGQDNDGDGYADCEDFDCVEEPTCDASYETGAECSDGQDNDGDGYTDCEDFDCKSEAACVETQCDDGVDNDGDGYTDCDDFDCLYAGVCPNTEVTDTTCSDGVDNDGNGFTDCDDFSCQRAPGVTVCEGNAVTCADGIDNDGDGFADCQDYSCRYCSGTNSYVVSTCPSCDATQ